MKIKVRMTRSSFDELMYCEEGAHEDKPEEHVIADCTYCIVRHRPVKGYVTLVSQKEVDSIYYAVCSGTFQIDDPAEGKHWYRVARRVADELRPHASPELVKQWPAPSGG
ncbi:MAG: hypothetical protein WBG86_20640 [Polyangiales bacterium]